MSQKSSSGAAATRPTARVLALLEILQAGGTHTVAELATRLGVDDRTVRRYVVHLADLDVPVRSLRGRYGGYRLGPGYRLPPLMLTDDEAVAVLLGLTLSRRNGLRAASAAATESAVAKLRRVLPSPLGARLDAVLAAVEVTAPNPAAATPEVTDRNPAAAAPESAVLLLLAEAAREHRPVMFDYTARDGRRSERTLHPYGIVAHSGRWYVTGADSASGEVRTFRLARMQHPTLRLGSFDVPDGFDPVNQVLAGIAGTPWRHEILLRVQGRSEEVLASFPARIATVEETADDGWVQVHIRAERLDWVPGLLADLPFPFVVERPDALRDLVRDLASRLTTAAASWP